MKDDNHEIETLFKGMNRTEMAFYVRFNLFNHSVSQKRKIKSALEKQKLTTDVIEKIVSENAFSSSHQEDSCRRCGSYKVYKHETTKGNEKLHCLICSYVEGQKTDKRCRGILRRLFRS